MKPFEERYTAWVDGLLSGKELADFEAELRQNPEWPQAQEDRDAARQLGVLLRSYSNASALENADFFNHQVLKHIEADQPKPTAEPVKQVPALWRFIWAGISCLGVAALVFITMVMPQLHTKGPPAEYYAQILNAKSGDPGISAVAYHDKKDNVTVLWLDGLAYMPKEPNK